ncbi:MAG: anion permease [Verrucomicrobiales bacterium]|nr:anion permease [Verrucomicrobiales bacterium]
MATESKTEDAKPAIHYPKLGICLLVGLILWLTPAPQLPAGLALTEGADFAAGWKVFAVFAATILCFILRPINMGPAVLLALVILAATGTLGATGKESFQAAMAGYGNTTVWLVVGAFLIAGAMIRTGLGHRIALNCVSKFGKTTLGLGYATAAAEFILGPAIPSNTARGGGVMAPIVNSLSRTLGSTPESHPKRAGEYLMLNGSHLNLVTAAMFLTGMAANGLVVEMASKTGEGIEFGWMTWLKGSIVPGLASLLFLPWFLFKLLKPELHDTQAAQKEANQQLSKRGNWSIGEKIMLSVFVLMLVLWATGKVHGMHTGVVALIGVMILVLTGTEKWEDITGNKEAWDAMVWLGGMVCMAGLLKEYGFIEWFAETMKGEVYGMGALATGLTLALIYFYSMYGFSMLTGHITAMVAAFLALAISAEVPAMLMVALLAYFSNLCGCLTNYSSGPVVIYSGLGYVPVARWFKIGFLVSLFHLVVWLGVGLPYWKLLGWW